MTKSHHLDLAPQWQGPVLDASKPKGLIDQILDDGAVTRDFVMRDTTYQVKTTVRFEPDRAWLFRCAVLCDGVEEVAEPWGPIFRNLTSEMVGREADPAARLVLARQALEAHLALGERLSRQLEETGELARPVSGFNRTFVLAAVLISLGAAAGGVWLWQTGYLQQGWSESFGTLKDPESQQALSEIEPLQSVEAEGIGVGEESSPEPLGPHDEDPVGASGRLEKSERAVAPSPIETRVNRVPARRSVSRSSPPRSAPSRSSPPRSASLSSSPVSSSTGDSRTFKGPSGKALPDPSDLGLAPAEPKARKRNPLILEVVPNNHRSFVLEAGTAIYDDSSIRLSQIPKGYGKLSCVTTRAWPGDTEQGILIRVSRPARLFVAHDRRVKKAPPWIGSFEPTGDLFLALEVDRGKTIEYSVYSKDVPAGAVALGPNTGAKRVVKKARAFGVRKRVVMYLVCLADSGAGSAASEGAGP